jgi:hypothetical protein
LLEGGDSFSQRRWRKHHVDGHAQFRFKPGGPILCAGLEDVHVARHRACMREQCPTLIRQHRQASAAIEQLHPELPFQIRQGLAHHGLRAPQVAASRRETFLIRYGDENAELIE